MTLEWIPTSDALDQTLQENLKLRTDNHVAFVNLDFLHAIPDMSEASEFAQRVSRLMPKTIAALIEKSNDDPVFLIQNNHAYHLPMDMVYAYATDFVNRHVMHCVHAWDKAIPAAGLMVDQFEADKIRFYLAIDLWADEERHRRALVLKIVRDEPNGMSMFFKTDRIAV